MRDVILPQRFTDTDTSRGLHYNGNKISDFIRFCSVLSTSTRLQGVRWNFRAVVMLGETIYYWIGASLAVLFMLLVCHCIRQMQEDEENDNINTNLRTVNTNGIQREAEIQRDGQVERMTVPLDHILKSKMRRKHLRQVMKKL
nr:uncharacterized protein LOC131778910 [Pocillopora verrucosa]